MIPAEGVVWRKSSRSNGSGGGECVELTLSPIVSAVRDTKNRSTMLTCSGAALEAFLWATKGGQFDS